MEDRKTLPLIPLRDLVVFPHSLLPLLIGREKSLNALDESLATPEKLIFMSAQINAQVDNPTKKDIYQIGTIGKIKGHQKLPDGNRKIIVEGLGRGRIINFIDNHRYILVEIEVLKEEGEDSIETKSMIKIVTALFEKFARLSGRIPLDFVNAVKRMKTGGEVSDAISTQLPIPVDKKQKILETTNVLERLKIVKQILEEEIKEIQEEKKVREKTFRGEGARGGIMGQGDIFQDEWREEIEELERKAEEKDMPEHVREVVMKEIKKLRMMSPISAEATVVRNYVDWLLSLPWTERSEEKLDIKEAKKVLDEDHWGLEKVKERILEYLAVRKLAGPSKAPILCFVGPPGVGKTSLAKSIARATGRRFVRLSLGGVRDEAEIRGHRRTYIGALPGRIIQMMKKAETKNPVFLLDEVDKLTSDFRGDPAAALLEVLDPEQNHAFLDHYIDIEYDLSEVFFICTANVTYTIPPALLDRMEVIHIPGYTEYEKYHITKNFLIPKEEKNVGLPENSCEFSKDAILKIIREYTREAGVRNLSREIGNVLRKIAKQVVEENIDPTKRKFKIFGKDIIKYLGPPKFKEADIDKIPLIGVARGLAWTESGGEALMIETALVPGQGKLIITGKLGDVMQESVKAAVTYIRSRAEDLGIETDFHSKMDIHVHVPEGAVPKDGPSAGITIATALASALTKIPTKPYVAMTGEITLRGRVLPIGGLKEKLLAAHRYKIKTVLIPKENEKDLIEVPKEILKDLEIIFVEHMDEVLSFALDADKDTIWKGKKKKEETKTTSLVS